MSARSGESAGEPDSQMDAYEAALRAEREVAFGTGSEDRADFWMGQASERR
ncbi:hypothetical protein OS965_30065 [Streptomyces sp. H27-G5]|uniref:hypothetical protein n=1 Tax=Streptomyces sp. H27-G5 TaxID=2996698 RepID=UPI0022716941|nr:hypothetical protein [Streptomyces sp. H27-G5]MCY0922357.1 hypothetical protein [Streptomyces sp. H27-G5]